MQHGDEFEYNGNRYQFDRYFQYKTPVNSPILISAKRWIKSKQKFSSISLLIAKKGDVEINLK